MKIAVIGAGAMGSIYGGRLSLNHEVCLVDTNTEVVKHVNEKGILLEENGEDHLFHPKATTDSTEFGTADLVILFVKALFSKAALSSNRNLIGPDTYLMTLQNGSGHEDILGEFVDKKHVIIGTTEDQGTILGMGHIRHGGVGNTNLGMVEPDEAGILNTLKEAFDCCGFHVKLHDNIQQLIWDKLFTNVSLSALTGVLQVKMGFIAENEHAFAMTRRLIHEAVEVAHAMGLKADEEALVAQVEATSRRSPQGVTSICADLGAGRRTEVDTISGSVVRAAKKVGVEAPCHEFLVHMIHAMEDKAAIK